MAIAVRADESSKAAHKRLDGINGQIGRLNDKADVLDGKLDEVLLKLAKQDGAENVRSGLLESKRFWIGIAAILISSSLLSLLVTLALKGHP